MDPPSATASREALQLQAYLLWEAAGFPSGQSDHFWMMAEQQLAPVTPAGLAVSGPARKAPATSRRKPPAAAPPPAAEAAPVHPTRRQAITNAPVKAAPKVPAQPGTAKKASATTSAKSPRKSTAPPPPGTLPPAAKRSAKSRKPKSGDAA